MEDRKEREERNEAQKQIVETLDRHVLVIAPAGTGKTDSLACRVANILRKKPVAPEEILCLTFTNKAAQEMKERMLQRVGEPGRRVQVKTFHSFCFEVVKRESKKHSDLFSDFMIFDEVDCCSLLKMALEEGMCEEALHVDAPVSSLVRLIDHAKETMALLGIRSGDPAADRRETVQRLYTDAQRKAQLREKCLDERYRYLPRLFEGFAAWGAELWRGYDERLHSAHGLDFMDLLVEAWRFFLSEEVRERWADHFRYIHVDEVQDTSVLEYEILTRIFDKSRILFAGDIFQTIYEWRGSRPELILRSFQENYHPVRIVLRENYRSTQLLLNASFFLLKSLFPKKAELFYPEGMEAESQDAGAPIEIKGAQDFSEEAQWIYYRILSLPVEDYSRVVILARSNPYCRDLSASFRSLAAYSGSGTLPFLLVDDLRFFRRQEIKDALAFLRLAVNPHDIPSLTRILPRFAKGIGPSTIRTIQSAEYRRAGISLTDYVDVAARAGGDPYAMLMKAWDEENLVVFDVESTGLDVTADEIVEIAGIRLDKEGGVKESFQRFLRPSRAVGSSEAVHHFSDAFLQEKGEAPEKALKDFCDFARGAVLIGHNVTYDLKILGSCLSRLGLPAPACGGWYDTLDIYRRFQPNLRSYKLSYLGELCQVNHPSTHDAFDDICATAEILHFALVRYIRPNTEKRRSCFSRYQQQFAPLAETIDLFRRQAAELRPWQLLGQIVVEGGLKAFYQQRKEEQRIENLRDLFRRAKELDDASLRPQDSVERLLRYTTLSSTQLDASTAEKPKIPIITIHQAKGAEFDYVFLAGMSDGVFPVWQAEQKGRLEEEKRLFYVAVTRAKKQLFVSWSQFRYGRYQHESPFLQALPSDCVKRV